MSGLLRAHYGFEAGAGNRTLLAAYTRDDGAGIRFAEDIDVQGGVLLSGHRVIGYDIQSDRITLSAAKLDLGATVLTSQASILVGADDSGVRIAPDNITVAGNAVFHGGNANCADADWTMRDAKVAGTLSVAGAVELSGTLQARRGAGYGRQNATSAGHRVPHGFCRPRLGRGMRNPYGRLHGAETCVGDGSAALGRKGQPLARRRPHLAYPAALGTDGYG